MLLHRIRFFTVMLSIAAIPLAVEGQQQTAAAASTTAERPGAAEVNGVVITETELNDAFAPEMAKIERQIATMKREKLEALIDARLLAAEAQRRGITVATLLEDEVDAKAAAPTAEEIRSAVENNHGRVKGEEPLVQKYLAHQIQIEKLRARKAGFIQELRAKATISVHVQPASVNRVAISNSGSRAIGPENAPVTILEFADYYCPYCRQSEDILREVIAQYGDRVRLVYRDFPIDTIHPQARRAHEAARCANEQGKFWEYHALLFKNFQSVSEPALEQYAATAGLDQIQFRACMQSRKYANVVEDDVKEASRFGVTGTPTFFINGRMLEGYYPAETLEKIIDEELALKATVKK